METTTINKSNEMRIQTKRFVQSIAVLVAGAVFMASCTGSEAEMLKKSIDEKKTEIKEAEVALAELEKQYAKYDTTEEKVVNVLVETKRINPEYFTHHFTVNGVVEALDDLSLSPEMSGQITAVHVDEGQEVKKGDVLFELNAKMLRNNIAELESQLSLAEVVFKKQKNLWDQNIGSEMQYLEAKTNVESMKKRLAAMHSQLEMSVVKSPINGVVENVFSEKGELASPGMPVVHVVNTEKLKVLADVSESYMSEVMKGDSVQVTFPSIAPDFSYSLPIKRVGKTINTGNRTFSVEVEMKNEKEIIKPNALAKVQVRDYATDSAMVLPSAAVQQDSKGYFLFKVVSENGNDVARKTYVEIGKVSEGEIEVIPGALKFNDEVVTKGFNRVADGVKVKK